MQNIDILKRARAPKRAIFTRLSTEFWTEIEKPDFDTEKYRAKYNRISALSKEISEIDSRYHGLLLEDETITEVKIEEEFEGCENYVQGMFDIENKYLSRCETARDRVDGSLVESAANSVVNTESKRTIRLPKVELPKFKGNLEDWLSWWGQFSKINDDETLGDVDKFHYLLQAVVEGSRAQRLVCSYPISEVNYPKVVQALKDRFGDKNLLIEHYIRRLLKLVVSNARKENLPLDEIYDDLTAHLKNLESLGVNTEMAGVFLYPLVESSLPLDIIQVWQRNPAVGYGIKEEGAENGDKSDASGRLQAMMDFLRDEVKGAERMAFAKENFEGNSSMRATGSQLKTPRKTPPTVSNLFGSAFKRKCIFCQRDNHLSSRCFVASRLTPSERDQRIKEAKVCFKCLKANHLKRECRADIKCRNCGKDHLDIFCNKIALKQGGNNSFKGETSKVVNEGNATCTGVNMSARTCANDILLMTSVAKLKGAKETKEVKVLFDTGSHYSYIKRSIVEKLGLNKIGEISLEKSLFGGGNMKEALHGKYVLKLGSLTNKIDVDIVALDQPEICARIPPIPRGRLLYKLKRKKIYIHPSNFRNEEIDILIGSDYFGQLLTGKVVHLGEDLTAVETKLGWTLMGQSPVVGKEDKVQIALNMLVARNNLKDLWELDILGIQDPIEAYITLIVEANRWFLDRRSKYSLNIRIMAWVLRFLDNARRIPTERGNLKVIELERAERKLLKLVQQETFPGKQAPKNGLKTIKSVEGLWCVETKLLHGQDSEVFKRPILLPRNHPLVEQMVREIHQQNGHGGAQFILSQLREKFWIIGGRRLIKQIIGKCVICRRHNQKPIQTPGAVLPTNRIGLGKPFEVTGVDLLGPLHLKGGSKVWVALFTCAVYRAVHLEIVRTLEANTFLLALKRFICRRGRPGKIYSDNGTNFSKTNELLKRLDWGEIERESSVKRIQWIFIPPLAPWWGGFWERLVRVVKSLLVRMLGFSKLNYVQLETALCEVESIINNRALSYISEDDQDLIPLTPQMFLQTNANNEFPELEKIRVNSFTRKYKILSKLNEELKQRFRKEYLGVLIQRAENKRELCIKEGDLVLIGQDNTKRILWPVGKIIKLYLGKDGVNRVARVKTSTGEWLRPVQRLFPLEISSEETPEKVSGDKKPLTIKTRSGREVRKPIRKYCILFSIMRSMSLHGMEMSSSKPSGSKTKRNIADEHRNFQEKWELEYFCSEVKHKIICLICNNAISVPKLYNIKRHYEQHKSKYDTYEGLMRQEKLKEFKLGMKKQQFMFTKVSQESEAAVHASYVLSEMIAKHSKHFTEGDFIKECLIKAAEIVRPGSVKTFQAISLTRNTVVERVTDMAKNLNDQIIEKSSCFEAFSIACDQSTDIGGVAQLAVFFFRACDTDFNIFEELLELVPMHGTTTGEDIFNCVYDLLQKYNLPQSKLTSVATDGAPSMTGKTNGFVALLGKKLSEISDGSNIHHTHCIIHQDVLCMKNCMADDPHDKIKDYRLETVTYGTSCAPFLATRIIKQLALDEQSKFPKASKIALTDFYADDLVTRTFSVDESKNLVQELYGLLSGGGFELRKWTSNVPDVLSLLPNHLRSTNTNIGFEESKKFVNVLGLQWQPRTDGFTFKGIALPLNSMKKRGILSQVAKIFDTLGRISPFTTTIKLILQELWKTGLEWNDPIPEELRRKLTLMNQDLPSLEHIQIPRCVVPGNFMKVEFDGFCDASQKAYAASLYLKVILSNTNAKTFVLVAKTRVAPMKDQQIKVVFGNRNRIAGPFLIKRNMGRTTSTMNAYVALFICFSTRAIHLELISSLTTDALISTIRRFIARRGKPATIHSDNATNFVGAHKIIGKLCHNASKVLTNSEGIQWKFIPPSASHFGGLWEAGVKSMKYHLRRTMGSALLNFEELTTLLAQIEACLNLRPLCPLSEEPEDLQALTPGHFLIGGSLTALPNEDDIIAMSLPNRWQLIQKSMNHFWTRWSQEYLSQLQQRSKWLSMKGPTISRPSLVQGFAGLSTGVMGTRIFIVEYIEAMQQRNRREDVGKPREKVCRGSFREVWIDKIPEEGVADSRGSPAGAAVGKSSAESAGRPAGDWCVPRRHGSLGEEVCLVTTGPAAGRTAGQQTQQRVLWRNSLSDAIQEYWLTTVTYGTAYAPYLAIRTLYQLANEEAMNYSVASKIVKRDFYVDDLLTGADTVEESQILIRQIIALLAKGDTYLYIYDINSAIKEKLTSRYRLRVVTNTRRRHNNWRRGPVGTSSSAPSQVEEDEKPTEDDDVTLDRVFSIAVSFELAEQNAKELQDGLVDKMDIVQGGVRKNEARRGWQHGPGMQSRETICFQCGEKNSHLAPACPHKTKSCFKCKRIGHLSRVSKTGKSLPDCRYVQDEFIYSVQGDTDAKINLHVDEYQLCFVVDTGSPVTLIPKTIYEKYWKDNKLSPSHLRLKSFCGKPIKIIGERRVSVREANQDLRLIVVDEDISVVLLGREWLKSLNVDFSRLLNIRQESPAELLMKRSLRSRFSNLIPKMAKVREVYHDAMRKQEHFSVGSDVYFRSFANGPKWKRGRIMELLSSRHYLIEDEGRFVKRHINQLRPVIKKEVPEVRDLVLPGTSRDFMLPGTSRDHPRLGGQEKTIEEAPEVDEELKGAESSAQEDTPEPEPGPAAAAVPVPVRNTSRAWGAPLSVELHGFCYSSEVAYAAVFYIRSHFKSGQVKVSLIASKTRVAPLKMISIPRLELCAALLLETLYDTIRNSLCLQIDRVFLWTDSKIVPSWIKSESRHWKPFVGNRIFEVERLTLHSSWHYVISRDNTADCASKCITPSELVDHSLWWRGPTWLSDVNFEDPIQTQYDFPKEIS
ncbi:hypothetical protein LAZ67_X002574, partial [Cordylochernes scorpioides]